MREKPTFDCFEGCKFICSGTLYEIADHLGLSIVTMRNYAYSSMPHRYQLYRWPRRERDIEDMRINGVEEVRES